MENWIGLQDELERYRFSVATINQYIRIYESECAVLIEKISNCDSFVLAEEWFDALHEIQRKLAIVKYKYDFPLSDRVEDLIYDLDRDDGYSREYWYEQFCRGMKWPNDS